MSRLCTLALVFGLVAPATGTAASDEISNPLMVFAACAGRLSAEMEHKWLVAENPDEVTRQRAAMIDLVDAIRPPERGREVLARRIEAKFAQAALLQRALFSTDEAEARQAATLARAARHRCLYLIPQIS
ncbi:hypothetical protein [Pseudooceanicola sp.]|uniref:hypothetical protein n=1 Tax=Pseudooceanicola sp. TaxID=1914328 RepID=UPI0035C76CBE